MACPSVQPSPALPTRCTGPAVPPAPRTATAVTVPAWRKCPPFLPRPQPQRAWGPGQPSTPRSALQDAGPISEGCFCPEGMTLFSTNVDICVPAGCHSRFYGQAWGWRGGPSTRAAVQLHPGAFCHGGGQGLWPPGSYLGLSVPPGCLGPHGEPVEPGHTVTVDCQECTCDGVARTLRCRTQPCPPPPVCPELGLVPMPAAPQAGQCCPQYSCGEPWVGGARAASPTSAEGHARTSSGLESFAMRGCGAGSWGPHPRKKVSHCPLLRPPWCPQWSVPPGEPHHLPPGRSGHPETPGGRTGS